MVNVNARMLCLALLAILALSTVGAASAYPIVAPPNPPRVPEPPNPQEEPIYVVADGTATLQSGKVVAPAKLYLAGKVQYNPWLPIVPFKDSKPQARFGWIKVEVLRVHVGDRVFNLSGYGTLSNNRITIVGWSVNARVYVAGFTASDSTVKLKGTLLVQPQIRPLPQKAQPITPPRHEVWQLTLHGIVSSQPPAQP